MGLADLIGGIFGGRKEGRPKIKAKCPKCKADVDTSMERCPSCGTHIDLMFRIKCPECGAANKLDEKECHDCKAKLYDEKEPVRKKTRYVCPICGYRADYYMLKCPACETRFV
ncbi:MAG: zinc ribbon domain-containing protein [Candidatus Micrarchaeota archaeon]